MMKKKSMIGVLVLIFVLGFQFNGLAVINTNGGGGGYGGNGSTGESTINFVEYNIILGAGYFLNANADIQALLNRVELEELWGADRMYMDALLSDAACNMKAAAETYASLLEHVKGMPYDQTVQAQLKVFDYDGYMLKHGLNRDIFNRMKTFLQAGDINGVFQKNYSDFLSLTSMLAAIKKEKSATGVFNIKSLRSLNEACAEASLFGSYVARVFAEVRR